MADTPRASQATVGADKAFDTAGFVVSMREQGVTLHVAQNTTKRRNAIDGRTTRHGGYGASQIVRKLVEHPFGWLKSAAGLWQVKCRGRDRVDLTFTFGMGARLTGSTAASQYRERRPRIPRITTIVTPGLSTRTHRASPPSAGGGTSLPAIGGPGRIVLSIPAGKMELPTRGGVLCDFDLDAFQYFPSRLL